MPSLPTNALSSSSSPSLFPISTYSSPRKTQLRFRLSFALPRFTNRRPMTCSATSIEKEAVISERPHSFLRETDGLDDGSVRSRFQRMIMEVQDSVCGALEALDGAGNFKEDAWTRPGGGGGISRVLQDGHVFEKAGVNVSVVYGVMPPEAYRAAKAAVTDQNPGPVPFFAAGISSLITNFSNLFSLLFFLITIIIQIFGEIPLKKEITDDCGIWVFFLFQVLHPKNPFSPTLHFNYRYFETDAPNDAPGAPRQWWFGGGTDLTPSYIFEEDVKHFHSIQKGACDKFDPSFYPRFKKWCDNYFYIKHRDERRGLGGIFFDDLNDYDQEMLLLFATECANSVVPVYIPIVEKRKDTAFNERHKAWQQLRRGRYVEFNLVYDRGTTFGLKTGGRIESILVSLPLTARWEYDHKPEEGSEEWKLLDACRNPKEWV